LLAYEEPCDFLNASDASLRLWYEVPDALAFSENALSAADSCAELDGVLVLVPHDELGLLEADLLLDEPPQADDLDPAPEDLLVPHDDPDDPQELFDGELALGVVTLLDPPHDELFDDENPLLLPDDQELDLDPPEENERDPLDERDPPPLKPPREAAASTP
jgi:hypothetical protein